MKRFEYAIVVEESQTVWTMWHQDQHGDGKSLTKPMTSFTSDLAMLRHMSQDGWDLVCPVTVHDRLPRLIFKRRLR